MILGQLYQVEVCHFLNQKLHTINIKLIKNHAFLLVNELEREPDCTDREIRCNLQSWRNVVIQKTILFFLNTVLEFKMKNFIYILQSYIICYWNRKQFSKNYAKDQTMSGFQILSTNIFIFALEIPLQLVFSFCASLQLNFSTKL